MGKSPKATVRRPLHLGDWLELTGHSVGDAARAAGVHQSYVSNMIAGRKKNPSATVLLAISEHIGVTMNDLYRPVPNQATIAAMAGLSPTTRDTIMRAPKHKN